ncbi:MAG: hypothetical protein BTN85_0652 [Candidatus Methanohalarchaeum thermophilum]|uniref:Uncharacterized protein n=1 Tax=Methanohalarchaeum thermophilum TaxID=1903181 RepID=A0A1Q6DV05_METT1|nr:MAG: hypothetical protein BTN85_0652 [Candidatus Methanohalarchaeum thermophilum]
MAAVRSEALWILEASFPKPLILVEEEVTEDRCNTIFIDIG